MAVYNSLDEQDLALQSPEDWYYGIFYEDGGFDEDICNETIYNTCRGCGWTPDMAIEACTCKPIDWQSAYKANKH